MDLVLLILIVVFVLLAISVIIGMRRISAATERTATAVEALVAARDRQL